MIKRIALAACAGVLALSAVGGVVAKPAEKVTICHHTSSETNPFVVITISGNAKDKHFELHGGTGPDSEGEECGDDNGDGET